MERHPRTVREVTQIQHFIQKGDREMKKYVVCGDCGRKLCKAEPGSIVELVCPKCKKPVVAMVKEDGIVMLDQNIKKAT